MEISARQLGKLIGVTERSIHRAEKTGKLGTKITLAMELFLSRMAHGEIDILSSLEAPSRRGRPPKVEPMVVSEDEAHYHTHWHGEFRTGADIRRWRRSIGIYQKELAKLLGVDVSTLVRAEQSESPSSGLIYGAELYEKKSCCTNSTLLKLKIFVHAAVDREKTKQIPHFLFALPRSLA